MYLRETDSTGNTGLAAPRVFIHTRLPHHVALGRWKVLDSACPVLSLTTQAASLCVGLHCCTLTALPRGTVTETGKGSFAFHEEHGFCSPACARHPCRLWLL